MSFHYDATSEFTENVSEVETLKELSLSDEKNRVLFLKLATVSLVTKFQVFVENILREFKYQLNGVKSSKLSRHIKMNALRMSLEDGNVLTGLKKHKNFTEDKKNGVVEYLKSISFISNGNVIITDSFKFSTKFPLGKTGKQELIELLKQIDGDSDPFSEYNSEKFDFEKLDSILQERHQIIHQDRFSGTENTLGENIEFIKDLVTYIDKYVYQKWVQISSD